MQGSLEIPCVVNRKLIGTKKNREILAKYLEMVQTHYTELNCHLMKMLSWVFSWLCLLMKMQILQTVKTAPNVPIKGGKKSLKNITIPNPIPSSNIRTLFKRTEYRREQVTPETEGKVPSNAIKSDLIVIN